MKGRCRPLREVACRIRALAYARVVRFGSFQRAPYDRDFRDSGPTRGHLLVFPREAVAIAHAGERAIVADTTRVMIYNRGQEYTRAAISSAGDRCDWIAFDAADVLAACGGDDEARPFGARTYAACAPWMIVLARRIAAMPGASWADEAAFALLGASVASLPLHVVSPAHRDLADAARAIVARRFAEPFALGDLARELGVSPFHLARVFRAAHGTTIHAYRTELRLRAALERIGDGEELAAVALSLGFSSHSHFTHAFRRRFGVAPSKILTA